MKRKIVFLLFPNTHLMDFAGPAQVFYEANQIGKLQYELIYAAVSNNVQTAQHIQFSNLPAANELQLKAQDLICIPGIDFIGYKKGEVNKEVGQIKKWIWKQKEKGVYISSICSGALILGQLGLLNHIHCTTHWKCMDYMKEEFPLVRLDKNKLYCFDKGIFTSAGMTAGIDMALALIEKWHNPLLAAKVAQEMVINVRRQETQEQKNIFLDFKNHFNPDVYKAQEILANRMEVKYTVNDLAKALNLSPRHLLRIFKLHTGQTIHAFRNKLRIEHGEKLLMHTEMSVKEIAVQCGFETSRQFIRIWKKEKGNTPGQYRRK